MQQDDLFTKRKQNTKQKPTRGKKHNQRTMNTTETQNKHRLRTRRPNQETYDNEQIVGKYSLSHRSSGVRPNDNSSIELNSKNGGLSN